MNSDMISFFRTGFIVCLTLAILLFVVSVVLFFLLDIKNVFNIESERDKKKKIEEMAEINSMTGRLINHNGHSGRKKRKNGPITEQINAIKQNGMSKPTSYENSVQQNYDRKGQESKAGSADKGEDQTTLLNDSDQTTLLSEEIKTTLYDDEKTSDNIITHGSNIENSGNTNNITADFINGDKQVYHPVQIEFGNGHTNDLNDNRSPDIKSRGRFAINREIMFIHTTEQIQ